MAVFLTAFDEIPDSRADNARHDLGKLLVTAFVSVLCGATSDVLSRDSGHRAREAGAS